MPKPYIARVRYPLYWGQMDALGHVNNTVYFRFFEEARATLFDAAGLKVERRETQIGPILAATSCQYLSPLTHPDEVIVEAWIKAVGRTSFTVGHQVKSVTQDRVVAEGDGVVVNYDYERGEKTPIGDKLRARLVALQGGA